MLARNQKQNLMWGILLILFGVTALIGEMFSFVHLVN